MLLVDKFKKIKINKFYSLRVANLNDMKFRPNLINSPLTNKTLLMDPNVTVKNSITWLKNSINKNCLPLTISDFEDKPLGMTGLTQVDFLNKRAQFYITFDPKIRGMGMSKIVIKKVLSFAKKNKLKKIYLFTLKNNLHARNIYEKNSFNFEAKLKKHFFKKKKFHDVFLHSVIF